LHHEPFYPAPDLDIDTLPSLQELLFEGLSDEFGLHNSTRT
jgi:hypothetical protein